jgi:sugar phosphate isomerase/epimerase
MSEMGDPAYLRAFVDETRLTGLRFNFDVGHANLADGPAEERIEKGFALLRDLVASVHLHDNHGDKDEHLAPYDGSIDWSVAIPLLKSAPQADLPVVLELKEKFGAEAPSVPEHLAAARDSFEKFENAW